ncbi:UPF0182 family protein, partial [Chloroflexi bacterium TSY]|nr:UPF0182 family protein [Chloroflexi bacterium TSY]
MRDKDPLSDLIRSIEESLQGGNWEPPTDDDPPAARPLTPVNPRRYVWAIAPLIIVIFLVRLLSLSTDWLWYSSLNLQSIFFTRITASIALFFVSALIFWVIWSINIFMMRRLTPNALDNTSFEHIVMLFGLRIYPLMLSIGAIIALFVGLALAAEWEIFLLYFNQIHFGLSDPLFGQDISFFLFTLPVWQIVHRWLLITLTLSLGANLIMSGIGWQGWVIRKSVSIHLSILAALILLLLAAQFRLSAYSLVYSQRGAVFGAGYTDVNAQLPAYNTLAIIGVVYAILLPLLVVFSQSEALTQNLSERIRRSIRSIWGPVGILAAIWGIVAILGGFIYPALVQRFQVSPNELNLEGPFIQHNIEFTRQAFDLASIDNVDYDASTPLTSDALLSQPATIANVRLWDYRPLRQTYNQIQALRQYYQFNDVDIDRYTIDGQVRQVMLAARELVPEQLNENAQTWVNRKLIYTHGYGVAVSPVAQVSPDGLPEFLVQNLPPQGVLPIHQPQIYFGELNKEYIIADTDQAEFDYPQGNETVTTVFEGTTGIRMNFLTRLLFALRFADINILLSDDIRSDSQLLWRRNIMERVSLVAPFLHYDSDPYIVIGEDGNLYWFLDAYTTSNRFPYSEPTRGRNLTRTPINYIRNPVKVVMSAYDGSMNFYLLEQNEPIAATYARIFPTLFTDVSEMSSDLLSHIRYPIGLFSIQAQVLRTYHMTDLVDFYNREDLWEWPTELFEGNPQPMEPYYVLMQLPDQEGLDFIQ